MQSDKKIVRASIDADVPLFFHERGPVAGSWPVSMIWKLIDKGCWQRERTGRVNGRKLWKHPEQEYKHDSAIMALLAQIKCYLSSVLVFYAIYHIATTCPLCKPLPYGLENEDALCKYSHTAYSYVKPYAEPVVAPALEYYNGSPVKPYVDDAIVVVTDKYNEYVEPYVATYGPVVAEQAKNVYEKAAEKIGALKARLDDDSLSNVKKIVIPDEDNIDAFIGTPNPDQDKTVDPVTPEEDLVEPTPLPAVSETNVVPETEDSEVATATDESEPTEDVEPIPAKTDDAVPEEATSNGKLEKIVEEAESVVGQIAAEEVIEAAQAVGQAL